jgi:hypothetical protein
MRRNQLLTILVILAVIFVGFVIYANVDDEPDTLGEAVENVVSDEGPLEEAGEEVDQAIEETSEKLDNNE